MKAYRKQLDAAKGSNQTPEILEKPAVEKQPVEISPNKQARVNFMRNLVANARVRG